MELVKSVSHLFLFSLGFGNLLFSALVDPKLTGSGLNKVIIAISGASLFLAMTVLWSQFGDIWSTLSLLYYAIVVCHFILYISLKEKRTFFNMGLFLLTIGFLAIQSVQLTHRYSLTTWFFLSSLALTGIVSYSMILGHWYLVVPKLSERPLLLCLKVMAPVLSIKFLFGLFSVWQNWSFFVEGTDLGGGYLFNWVLFLMRMGWGYVALLVLLIYTWKLVKIRSIQSATGLLYVMVFFLLGGELISLYLALNYGLYI